jgi:hypothetical protein
MQAQLFVQSAHLRVEGFLESGFKLGTYEGGSGMGFCLGKGLSEQALSTTGLKNAIMEGL